MFNDVNSWRPGGRVYLWRYRDNTQNYPGWHLSADREGGLSLLALLALFEVTAESAHSTVPLSEPTPDVLTVPNNQDGRARVWAPTKWRIAYEPQAPDLWVFPHSTDPAILTLGSTYLPLLVRGVSDLTSGSGDYCIASEFREAPAESRELWFWWSLRRGRRGSVA
jgi:hypothetical protein